MFSIVIVTPNLGFSLIRVFLFFSELLNKLLKWPCSLVVAVDDLILRQGVEEEDNPSSRLQDLFLKQKPPSLQNDCDSTFGIES